MSAPTLQFLGAAGTVTGSRHLLSMGESRLLVDCGLFQGKKELRLKNWDPFPVPPLSVSAVALTHAHIDHSGYLPRFVKCGFHGPVYCSRPTADLVGVLLPDSGRLQEEDAEFANRHRFSKHRPALPLYTEQDAQDALRFLRPVSQKEQVQTDEAFQFHFHNAGHILGSKCCHVTAGGVSVLFTGDLGPFRANGTRPGRIPDAARYLVMESTYGDRLHPRDDVRPKLARIIRETVKAGGSVIIPAFAVERTQKLLFLIKELMETGAAPNVPIHLDSPMAIEAVKIFLRYEGEFDAETRAEIRRHGSPFDWPGVHFDRTVEQSRAASHAGSPSIIISSSGMATGGRVLHHLAQRLPDHNNTVVFVGFQAPATRGRLLIDGAQTIKIHGEQIPVRARIENLEEFSDHADYQDLLEWLATLGWKPDRVFLVHGEAEAAQALAQRIQKKFGWEVHVAQPGQEVALS